MKATTKRALAAAAFGLVVTAAGLGLGAGAAYAMSHFAPSAATAAFDNVVTDSGSITETP
ncbi:MAG TPA: hypothetical protein VFH48_21770 [Chloroflexota bacterium]|nr:hypothetical protein [Chloroflexota bacterium]